MKGILYFVTLERTEFPLAIVYLGTDTLYSQSFPLTPPTLYIIHLRMDSLYYRITMSPLVSKQDIEKFSTTNIYRLLGFKRKQGIFKLN